MKEKGAAISLFALLDQYPMASFTCALSMFLVAIFFLSGADAGSVVMGMLSERGTTEPASPVVVLWGLLAGASAAILLLMGGLQGLQTASTIAAAPFLLVMAGLCMSFWHAPMDELEDQGIAAE